MATETSTTAPATETAEVKPSIPQKVEALNADKTRLTSELTAATDENAKKGLQEQIAVIDRKLRWYAGRSGEGKKVATGNAPKERKSRKKADQPAAPPATPAAAPATASPATES